jgi:polyvinyl alcohol dehydrogenase (cytochrome)
MSGRLIAAVIAPLAVSAPLALLQAQVQVRSGEQVFTDRCAGCHTGAADSRAPSPDALRSRSSQAIIESLVNGAMRTQGSRMTGAERRVVAEFLTGRAVEGDVTGTTKGRCEGSIQNTSSAGSAWTGWSPSVDNTRFQSSPAATITASDISKLTLRWALGFPDASSAWAQPSVAGGVVYVGSQNGTVFAVAASTGCIYWTFAAAGGVRTAIAVAGDGRIYFGDTAANVYALDARTGTQRWVRSIESHRLARITGTPTLHDGRLYVPTSSYEESQGADPQYACCTFRGSISALDAATGTVIWKTYTIPAEPQRRGTSTAGVALWGPSGAAVWSAPTIDTRRGLLYVATGNQYSGPAHPASNAIIALDLKSGTVRWSKQVTPNDVYLTGCRAGNPNCPEANGPDLDFGSPPMLTRTGAGRDLIVIGQKSGIAFALDPDKNGDIVWEYRAGRGGVLGGIEWGSATDNERAYFAVSDITHPQPGGLHAVTLTTGQRAWFSPPRPPVCGTGRGCNAAQSAAVTAIPGAVFSGSNDGALRVYSTTDGAILWEFDTNREFPTVNGVAARGASMIGPGAVVAGGMVFVSSGYGAFGGRPGNVLLAFGVP